ncbi:UV-endonuclease UvdE-domain-containing protein [Pisolithus sp. B1]|nr:UV-endonuclease UvdE-domain-containing protein [Pisolithus sp. B1]
MRYSLRPRRNETYVSPDPATNPDDRLPEKGPPKRKSTKRSITDCQVGEYVPTGRQKKKRASTPASWDILDVEKKDTAFRGRLGYACLNTLLRSKKPAAEAIFCSRTCRIESIKKKGMEWVKDLGQKNAEDMLKIIEWNERNHIRFMRISSGMFPFASHETYGYSLAYCATLLADVGALAEKYGHRLTVHPGQYTQLGSPREAVVRSSIQDLEYHCEMLDLMGVGPDGVIVIHGGGVYGDKEATLARIKETIRVDLPKNVRDRLVLENDELCYTAAELLPICKELEVPLVFDYHHDMLNPSPGLPPARIIEEANEIFRRRGIKSKQHYSEPREGAVGITERRAHSDRCQILPQGLPEDMDLMIEAKDKEQAVLQLYRMYDLHPVNYGSIGKSVLKAGLYGSQGDIDT